MIPKETESTIECEINVNGVIGRNFFPLIVEDGKCFIEVARDARLAVNLDEIQPNLVCDQANYLYQGKIVYRAEKRR